MVMARGTWNFGERGVARCTSVMKYGLIGIGWDGYIWIGVISVLFFWKSVLEVY